MSLSAEEQHSQTILDTPEDMERGWEYWEKGNLSALTPTQRLPPGYVFSESFLDRKESALRSDPPQKSTSGIGLNHLSSFRGGHSSFSIKA